MVVVLLKNVEFKGRLWQDILVPHVN